jgi:hypothetical protein
MIWGVKEWSYPSNQTNKQTNTYPNTLGSTFENARIFAEYFESVLHACYKAFE